jgi:hypothetical protein
MGKKNKGKRQSTKPRKSIIQLTMAEAGSGKVELYGNGILRIVGTDGKDIVPARVEIASIYDRDSGKVKVITRGPGTPSTIHIDANQVLYPYASVIAVDTNTREIRGARVSASVMLRVIDVGTLAPMVQPMAAVEFHDARESPEHLGWHYAIRTLEASFSRPSEFELSQAQRRDVRRGVAIVVDSDLDALSAINGRTRPYFNDLLLPPDLTLIYGSSDVGGTEFIANKAIAQCDTIAAQLLRMIEADPQDDKPYEVDPSLPFARFRRWSVEAASGAKT